MELIRHSVNTLVLSPVALELQIMFCCWRHIRWLTDIHRSLVCLA